MFFPSALPAVAVAPCHRQTQNSIVRDPLQPGLQHRGVPRFENGRLTLIPLSSVIHLTQPSNLSLTLLGQGARCVHTIQCNLDVGNSYCIGRRSDTVQIVPVLSRRNHSHYITFTPLLTGYIGLIVTAEFSDGVFSEQTTYLTAEYPTQTPQKLTVTLSGSSGRVLDKIHLNLKQTGETPPRLLPKVQYASYPGVFFVEPDKVQFAMKTAGTGEVVRFEPSTGTITPVALGHVLLTTDFAGATTDTCVVVTAGPSDVVSNINCDDLLQP